MCTLRELNFALYYRIFLRFQESILLLDNSFDIAHLPKIELKIA